MRCEIKLLSWDCADKAKSKAYLSPSINFLLMMYLVLLHVAMACLHLLIRSAIDSAGDEVYNFSTSSETSGLSHRRLLYLNSLEGFLFLDSKVASSGR